MLLPQPVEAAPISDAGLANSGCEEDPRRLGKLCQSNLTALAEGAATRNVILLAPHRNRSAQLAAFAELTIRQRVSTHEPVERAPTGVPIRANRDLVSYWRRGSGPARDP